MTAAKKTAPQPKSAPPKGIDDTGFDRTTKTGIAVYEFDNGFGAKVWPTAKDRGDLFSVALIDQKKRIASGESYQYQTVTEANRLLKRFASQPAK